MFFRFVLQIKIGVAKWEAYHFGAAYGVPGSPGHEGGNINLIKEIFVSFHFGGQIAASSEWADSGTQAWYADSRSEIWIVYKSWLGPK